MRTIKTRNTVKNIKVLDKSVSTSKRMKDAFIRTKNKAEESQNASHATPTDYASDNIQVTTKGAAEETLQHLPTPRRVNSVRQRVSNNWNRAKGHFQVVAERNPPPAGRISRQRNVLKVKRQMPKERQRTAGQAGLTPSSHVLEGADGSTAPRSADKAQKTVQATKSNAIKLKSEADHAFNRAREAKSAVKDAKLALKEVRQSGRQTIREVKLDARQKMKMVRSNITGNTPIQTVTNATTGNISDVPRSASIKTPTIGVTRPVSDIPHAAPKNGKLIRQRINAIKMRSNVKFINNSANASATRIGTERTVLRVSNTTEHSVASVSGTVKSGSTSVAEFTKESLAPQSNNKLRLSSLNPFKGKSIGFGKKSEFSKAESTNQTASPPAKPATSFKTANTVIDGKPINDSVLRPSYTNTLPKSGDKTAQTLQSSAKAVKSTKKSIKDTAKGTVKTAKKSVKTAEATAKKAVKTAQQTAKTAHRTAKSAARTAKTAERASRVAAKTAVQTAKISVKAITAMAKATLALAKGVVSAIIAGGWIAVLAILIISMIALLVGSIYGIFFSGEPNEDGMTINTVIAEINAEYTSEIDGITSANTYDLIDMSGARASWKQVLAVYTVKTVTDPDNPMEVATVNDEKAAILKTIFWEMNEITYELDSVDVAEDVLDDDGLPTGETTTVTKTVLRITVTHKTPDEMAEQYGFSNEQKEWLEELLKPDYHSLWNSLLYGISTIGDGSMIEIADTQIGNVGGEPYWSWYGFTSRVEWCATFVSWVAEQCGYIDAGIIPRFSGCMNGIQWFKDRGQWQDNSYTPRPGDIIFFDWEPDGISDHVGIVESVTDGTVNTIEGNTSDSVARRSYDLGSVKIYGYGVPVY